MLHKISNEYASAEIDSFGAELKSYKDRSGDEYVWQPFGECWKGTSPILFPIVGRLRNGKAIIDGAEYSMDIHGFAKDMEFNVESKDESSITFSLVYSSETLKMYPYKFKFYATFALDKSKLITTYEVENLDDRQMMFGIGGHTGFKCPMEESYTFEDYVLEFSHNETADCPYVDGGMILVNHRRNILNNSNTIKLTHSLFSNDALIFDSIKSKEVKLYNQKTGKGIISTFYDFSYVAFWTQSEMDSPYICIEPWNGMGYCEDESDEFAKKRGLIKLDKGKKYSAKFDFDFI